MLKKETHSALRYCQRMTEVPYAELVEYSSFTVAAARVVKARRYPNADDLEEAPRLVGVLDGSTIFVGGDEEPMLPVDMTFIDRPLAEGERVGSGWVDRHYGGKEKFLVLRLSVVDPGLSLFGILDSAMERAALSRERFVHVWCGKKDERPTEPERSISAKIAEREALLKEVEAGNARFPPIHFDEVRFDDNLALHSEPWAWAWPEFEEMRPAFAAKGVASWRASKAKWSG